MLLCSKRKEVLKEVISCRQSLQWPLFLSLDKSRMRFLFGLVLAASTASASASCGGGGSFLNEEMSNKSSIEDKRLL